MGSFLPLLLLPPCPLATVSLLLSRSPYGAETDSNELGLQSCRRVCITEYCAQSTGRALWKEGVLLDYDVREGRWRVIMDDSSGLSLRSNNLQPRSFEYVVFQSLKPGLSARIVVLQSRPEMNGKTGRLLEFPVDEERWRVGLSFF